MIYWRLHKNLQPLLLKDTIKKIKTTDWEKYLQNIYLTELCLEYKKKYLKTKNKKTENRHSYQLRKCMDGK